MFGEVTEGYEIVQLIENVPKDGSTPVKKLVITTSGELPMPEEGERAEL